MRSSELQHKQYRPVPQRDLTYKLKATTSFSWTYTQSCRDKTIALTRSHCGKTMNLGVFQIIMDCKVIVQSTLPFLPRVYGSVLQKVSRKGESQTALTSGTSGTAVEWRVFVINDHLLSDEENHRDIVNGKGSGKMWCSDGSAVTVASHWNRT